MAFSTCRAEISPVSVTYCHEGSGTSMSGGLRMTFVSSLVPPIGGDQSSHPTLPGLPPHSGSVRASPTAQTWGGSTGRVLPVLVQPKTVTGNVTGSSEQPFSVSTHPAVGPATAVA